MDSKLDYDFYYRRQQARVNLPLHYSCEKCVIRLLRQASEWGLDYLFWSCADVTIIPHPEHLKCEKRSRMARNVETTTNCHCQTFTDDFTTPDLNEGNLLSKGELKRDDVRLYNEILW